jgi:hypothetical protein
MLADQRVQPGNPLNPVLQSRLAQPPTRLVLDLDIVVVLGPVISDQYQQPVLPQYSSTATRENYQRANDQVLTPTAGTTSHQRFRLPGPTGRGTICQ